jgi:hypothetical protein
MTHKQEVGAARGPQLPNVQFAEDYRPISGVEKLPKDGSASFLFSFEVA